MIIPIIGSDMSLPRTFPFQTQLDELALKITESNKAPIKAIIEALLRERFRVDTKYVNARMELLANDEPLVKLLNEIIAGLNKSTAFTPDNPYYIALLPFWEKVEPLQQKKLEEGLAISLAELQQRYGNFIQHDLKLPDDPELTLQCYEKATALIDLYTPEIFNQVSQLTNETLRKDYLQVLRKTKFEIIDYRTKVITNIIKNIGNNINAKQKESKQSEPEQSIWEGLNVGIAFKTIAEKDLVEIAKLPDTQEYKDLYKKIYTVVNMCNQIIDYIQNK